MPPPPAISCFGMLLPSPPRSLSLEAPERMTQDPEALPSFGGDVVFNTGEETVGVTGGIRWRVARPKSEPGPHPSPRNQTPIRIREPIEYEDDDDDDSSWLLSQEQMRYNRLLELHAEALKASLPCSLPKRRRTPRTSGWGSPASEPSDGDQLWSRARLEVDDPKLRALQELRQYTTDYLAAEKDEFWQRQSKKAVLSIVICRKRGSAANSVGQWVIYRGMNTEVALQTGSFCAERAALAQAFSSFQNTTEILCVATLDPLDKRNPLWPCGVCQTWFSKLHSKNPKIEVLAVTDLSCEQFSVQVNGVTKPPPSKPSTPRGLRYLYYVPPPDRPSRYWASRTESLSVEQPWEASDLVYLDGAWSFMHDGQLSILRAAGRLGSHLLVGIHSDDVVREATGTEPLEPYSRRLARLTENINVHSILKDAPWEVSHEMIEELGIKTVVTGSVSKIRDMRQGTEGGSSVEDPYLVPRQLGILKVLPSPNCLTEWQVIPRQQDRQSWGPVQSLESFGSEWPALV